ncbi:hypothetical protein N0V88_007402 [Collariella sp. IMI 366227]|nr:hypothetical protein N0V88_007402 [Collariella sp. IMI 366227]
MEESEPFPLHDESLKGEVWAALQRPYRTSKSAPNILESILNQARAALREAEEYVWALRENPSYFASEILEHYEHSYNLVKDVRNNCSPYVDAPKKKFWHMIVVEMMWEAYNFACEWQTDVALLEDVVEEDGRFLELGLQREKQSPEYFKRLLALKGSNDQDQGMISDHLLAVIDTFATNPRVLEVPFSESLKLDFLADPHGKRFEYPAGNRLTMENHQKMQAAEPTTPLKDEENAPAAQPPPIFPLPRNALNALPMLFHRPGQGALPGHMQWRDFLALISAVGFSHDATFGFPRVFTLVGDAIRALTTRTVDFHEPHPEHQVRFTRARGQIEFSVVN